MVALLVCAIMLQIAIWRKPLKFTVKINNFAAHWIGAIIYFTVYIILILLLRYYQINKKITIVEIKNWFLSLLQLFQSISIGKQISLILFIIMFTFLWALIILKLQQFLKHIVWKLYFYYVFINKINPDKKWSSVLEKKMEDFISKYSFHALLYNHFYPALYRASKRFEESMNRVPFPKKKRVIIIAFVLSIPVCILIEILVNRGQLYYTFYYFFAYVIIMHYIIVSEAIFHTHSHYEYPQILVERYYGFPKYIYVNLTKPEETLLSLYAANPGKLPYTGQLYHVPVAHGLFTEHFIYMYRRFIYQPVVLLKETNDFDFHQYHNENTYRSFGINDIKISEDAFFVEDLEDQDVMDYMNTLELKEWIRTREYKELEQWYLSEFQKQNITDEDKH